MNTRCRSAERNRDCPEATSCAERRVGGIENSGRRARKNQRLRVGHEGRDLVVLLIPGLDAIPAQAVINRQIGLERQLSCAKGRRIYSVRKWLKLALVVLARDSQQEISEIRSGFSTKEKKTAIELSDGVDVDLIVVEFPAGFHRMLSDDFRKIVEPLIGISNLVELIGVRPNSVAVETDALDAFGFRRKRRWQDSG